MRRVVVALCFAIMLAASSGCATPTESTPSSPRKTVTVFVSASTTPSSSVPATAAAPPSTVETGTTPDAAPVVEEGVQCSPLGATAVFADGTTAYCSRVQYTDNSVWSRNPVLAPNPAPPQTQTPTTTAAPTIGQSCIGADIGRTATDPNGTAIVCDNYQWVPNTGQTPQHPWADDQREWTECIQTHTTDECREILGTG
ncbi:hypothetical protein [uncultured Gordonia sp.]|uniref:hypothetical protein n=1 Tax=uncultured Gordonia sp. TaxID=198437 RepID=UPI00258C7519|nr:hypothetical protein [uncultured Gordonia sp.]